jgi:hypothetical protein
MAQEAIVGMLLALSRELELPARPWPLVAACQTLANELPPESPFVGHLERATSTLTGAQDVEAWLLSLAERGSLRAEGRANEARWIASPDWLANWQVPAAAIQETEVGAWAAASQALMRSLSIWRKTVSAVANGSDPSAEH